MQLTDKELLGLPVETKSGQPLGNLSGFEIDIDSQQIKKYFVKPKNIIKNLLAPELIIDYRQVISIFKEKMIVEDNIEKERIFLKKAKIQGKEAAALTT